MRKYLVLGVLVVTLVIINVPAAESPPEPQLESVSISVVGEHSPGIPPAPVPAVYIIESAFESPVPAIEASPPIAAAKMLMASSYSLHKTGNATLSRSLMTWISEVMPAQGPPAEMYDPRPRFDTDLRT